MIYPKCEELGLLKIDENLRVWPCAFVSNYTDEFLDALDEEFKNLEDYLRSKESQEIKKKQ